MIHRVDGVAVCYLRDLHSPIQSYRVDYRPGDGEGTCVSANADTYKIEPEPNENRYVGYELVDEGFTIHWTHCYCHNTNQGKQANGNGRVVVRRPGQ